MTLPSQTHISHLTLATGRLERLTAFYTQTLGLTIHGQSTSKVHLGAPGGAAFLTLAHEAGAQAQPPYATGLYHFALLLPSRLALAQTLAHLIQVGAALSGASDHAVSEALYLNDPDGNGIELTRDRPRAEWQWRNGLVGVTVDPLNLRGLLAEASAAGAPWAGLPPGTTLGHVHLRVRDLGDTARFYQDLLGFDTTAHYPGALFVSAGGYHHHFGLNTWQSRGAPAPPANAEGLRDVTITLPTREDADILAGRLRVGGWAFTKDAGEMSTSDPSGNKLRIAAEAGAS